MLADILHRMADLLPHPSETSRTDLHQQIETLREPEPEPDSDDPENQTGVPTAQ